MEIKRVSNNNGRGGWLIEKGKKQDDLKGVEKISQKRIEMFAAVCNDCSRQRASETYAFLRQLNLFRLEKNHTYANVEL